ncbi:MAG: alpha/beta hydrolase [Alphaproteobacteria bacterium]|nr:alpha/beta hydrolase [Alphaproteobacteria bacterium]
MSSACPGRIRRTMRLRRGFADVSFGQIHYRTAGEGRPGVPLVMFHGSPGSSFSLHPLVARMGETRRVIGPDTPGNGDSTPHPKAAPEIADLAQAHAEAIQALRLGPVDLYGFHTGASIAIELSIQRPALVRRMILDGCSLFDASAQAHLLNHDHAPVLAPDLDGTQLLRAWHMVRDAHVFWPWWGREQEHLRGIGLPSADYLHQEALEVLKALSTYDRSYRAALRYPKRERLPKVAVPTLCAAAPNDMLLPYLDEVARLIPGAEKARTPANVTVPAEDIEGTARVFEGFLGKV